MRLERQIDFSRAVADDAARLSALAFASKSFWPYPAEYLAASRVLLIIERQFIATNEVWIARVGGREPVGFFALCDEPEHVLLDHFWIAPDHIREGLGRAMFAKMLEVARQRGWTQVVLYADPPAEGFYLKMGAQRVGTRPSRVSGGPVFPVLQVDVP